MYTKAYLPISSAMLGQRRSDRRRCRRSQSDGHPVYAAHCWFNADNSSATLAQHYSNTGSVVYLAATPQQKRAIHLMLAQCLRCWPNIEQHWVIVTCLLGLHITMRVTFSTSRRQKSDHPDHTIHWPNADVMPGHRL